MEGGKKWASRNKSPRATEGEVVSYCLFYMSGLINGCQERESERERRTERGIDEQTDRQTDTLRDAQTKSNKETETKYEGG